MSDEKIEKVSVKKRIVKICNELRIGKDGKNSFSNYDYFKPDDILKHLNPLLLEHNLIAIFSLNNSGEYYKANLVIEDTESDEAVTYDFDICKATVKGANEAQNSGATLTYAKRYSLMNAFNIADNDDDFDSKKPIINSNKNTTKQDNSNKLISFEQCKRLYTIAQGNKEIAKKIIKQYGYESAKDIELKDYEQICTDLEIANTNIDNVKEAN